jgi:hypothetical protein
MKKLLVSVLAACAIGPVLAQPNVNVSIGGVIQPGVYGRIDIGNMPPPAVVYPQPVVIAPTPVAVYQRPIYLHVPPGHQKNWRKHCGRYGACGQPVYFVQERWVRDQYDARRGGGHRGDRGGHRGHGHR